MGKKTPMNLKQKQKWQNNNSELIIQALDRKQMNVLPVSTKMTDFSVATILAYLRKFHF